MCQHQTQPLIKSLYPPYCSSPDYIPCTCPVVHKATGCDLKKRVLYFELELYHLDFEKDIWFKKNLHCIADIKLIVQVYLTLDRH